MGPKSDVLRVVGLSEFAAARFNSSQPRKHWVSDDNAAGKKASANPLTRRPGERPTDARRALGAELRRIREDALGRTGEEMADWLGISKVGDPGGARKSTGKSRVSQLETGHRIPDQDLLDQYRQVPGIDFDRLDHLHAAARLEATESDPVEPADQRSRNWTQQPVLWAAIVAIVVGATVGIVIAFWSGGTPPVARSTTSSRPVELIFDALGPRSDQTILVYLGYSSSTHDHQTDLSYQNGERALAICQARGRRIKSDPAAGEQRRVSRTWIGIRTSAGSVRYATLTYGRLKPSDARLPAC